MEFPSSGVPYRAILTRVRDFPFGLHGGLGPCVEYPHHVLKHSHVAGVMIMFYEVFGRVIILLIRCSALITHRVLNGGGWQA